MGLVTGSDAWHPGFMQVGPGGLVRITISLHEGYDMPFTPEFVAGALEGFAAVGLFGVKSVSRMEVPEGLQQTRLEVEVLQGSRLRVASIKSRLEKSSSEDGRMSDQTKYSPPSLQFKYLMPFHILTDSRGKIVQVGPCRPRETPSLGG